MTIDGTMDVVAYEAPSLLSPVDELEAEHAVLFAIVVGFSFAAALAYASYCIYRGGSPSVSFGWSGFKVTCVR
jgi:hypothetical protein